MMRTVLVETVDLAGTVERIPVRVWQHARTHRCDPRSRFQTNFGYACALCYPTFGLGERIAELVERTDLYQSVRIVREEAR